jgi:RNA:NAD 2'-phosphotransferase (TPT1/KptA family)
LERHLVHFSKNRGSIQKAVRVEEEAVVVLVVEEEEEEEEEEA